MFTVIRRIFLPADSRKQIDDFLWQMHRCCRRETLANNYGAAALETPCRWSGTGK